MLFSNQKQLKIKKEALLEFNSHNPYAKKKQRKVTTEQPSDKMQIPSKESIDEQLDDLVGDFKLKLQQQDRYESKNPFLDCLHLLNMQQLHLQVKDVNFFLPKRKGTRKRGRTKTNAEKARAKSEHTKTGEDLGTKGKEFLDFSRSQMSSHKPSQARSERVSA